MRRSDVVGFEGPSNASPTLAESAGVDVRALHTMDDLRACVDLQREVWGFDTGDLAPAALMHVIEYVGGVVAGAFDAGERMLGFVFGITGVRDGDLVHWSHMLAVRESARDHGIGRRLKEHQREVVRDLGVKRIYWSVDPLQAKNAYFNIYRLGAAVEDYVDDMYGETGSPLHLGMPTDRLVMRIDTTPSEIPAFRLASDRGVPVLTPFPVSGDRVIELTDHPPDVALIEMPANIMAVLGRSPSVASQWRSAVRANFHWALGHGYSVIGVYRDPARDRAYYVAAR